MIFGVSISRLREDRGWTQETLAERAEMNVSYLGFIEPEPTYTHDRPATRGRIQSRCG